MSFKSIARMAGFIGLTLFGCEGATNATDDNKDTSSDDKGGIIVNYPEGACDRGSAEDFEETTECIRARIYLNFNGFEFSCNPSSSHEEFLLEVTGSENYCQEGEETDFLEGFEGIKDREAEMEDIVNHFRCFFGPLGFEVVTEKPTSGHYNQINIGGQADKMGEGGQEVGGFSSLDIGNVCHDNDIFVFEKYSVDNDGQEVIIQADRSLIPFLVAHEFGHALGLKHLETEPNIMSPTAKVGFTMVADGLGVGGMDTCENGFTQEQAELLTANTAENCDAPTPEEAEELWRFKEERCEDECTALKDQESDTPETQASFLYVG